MQEQIHSFISDLENRDRKLWLLVNSIPNFFEKLIQKFDGKVTPGPLTQLDSLIRQTVKENQKKH